MAKRQSDTQLTKDDFEAQRSRADEGGPDSTEDPVKLASSEVMKKRVIKQPKSRLPPGVSRPNFPQPTFSSDSITQPVGTFASSTNGNPLGAGVNFPFASIATNGSLTAPSSPAPLPPAKPLSSSSSAISTTKLSGGLLFGASGITSPAPPPKPGPLGSPITATSKPPSLENKKSNPFETLSSPAPSLFGANTSGSDMPANKSTSTLNEFNKPKQYTGSLFGSSLTTNSAASDSSLTNLFGSANKAVSPLNPSTTLFANASRPDSGVDLPKPQSNTPVTPSSSSAITQPSNISYPDLSSAASPKLPFPPPAAFTTPLKSRTSINFHVPPLPPNLDPSRTEEYEKLYKLRSLNEAFKNSLKTADSLGDFREACHFYSRIAGEILSSSASTSVCKRKEAGDEAARQSDGSPKKARTEQGLTESRSAAKVLESIIDRNLGKTAPTQPDKKVDADENRVGDEEKVVLEAPAPSKSPTAPLASNEPPKTTDKPVSNFLTPSTAFSIAPPATRESTLFSRSLGNALAEQGKKAPSSVFSNSASPPTPASQPMSNIFAPGGGPSVAGPPVFGAGLFADLKPTITKDPGEDEENSPKKLIGTGLGLFGAPKKEEASQPRINLFGSANKDSSATPRTDLFNLQKHDLASTGILKPGVWTPGTPVVFGGQSTSFNPQPSQAFVFGTSSSTSLSQTSSSGSSKLGTNGANISDSGSTPFDGVSPHTSAPSTAAGTPGPDSDKEGAERNNEPSDDVPAVGEDWSVKGPGEELEDIVHSTRAVIYQKNADKFTKLGVGALRLLKHQDTGKKRIVLRTEQGRVVLNVLLHKEVSYAIGGQKNTVSIPSFTNRGAVFYLAKLKGEDEAAKLSEVLQSEKSS